MLEVTLWCRTVSNGDRGSAHHTPHVFYTHTLTWSASVKREEYLKGLKIHCKRRTKKPEVSGITLCQSKGKNEQAMLHVGTVICKCIQ